MTRYNYATLREIFNIAIKRLGALANLLNSVDTIKAYTRGSLLLLDIYIKLVLLSAERLATKSAK